MEMRCCNDPSHAPLPPVRRAESGFSLVELITVLVIIGVLAAFVGPRLMDKQVFDERGFFDGTQAILRYAQKTAIAKRRMVCVVFGGNSVTLRFASTPGAAACDTDLPGPAGEVAPYQVQASSANIYFSPVPTNFSFDALGRPSSGPITISINGIPRNITVEAETGYVHT